MHLPKPLFQALAKKGDCMRNYTNGEHYLLLYSPIFKRRYTVDCDIVMGCSIGCQFCYYRWVAGASEYFGTGKLYPLCSPEELAEILETSRIVRKDKDGIMMCARSDGSIQLNKVEAFLRAFRYYNLIFLLHRGYFDRRQLEAFEADKRVIFCTTLTPAGKQLGWTPIDEYKQLEGISFLVQNGVSPRRISVEVGPINENNINQAVDILQKLQDIGLEFATYRGVSVGMFEMPSPENELINKGFLTTQKPNAEDHAYYHIKNFLTPELQAKLCGAVNKMRLHRFTGTLYRDEFGLDIAYNRKNRRRKELGPFPEADLSAIRQYVANLGYPVEKVEKTSEGYLVTLDPTSPAVTEDVAMTVGAEFNTCVVFNKYKIAPDMEDVKLYAKQKIIALSEVE